ncbi:unnamed protein product [Paramecium octaurelia]|uniref:Uncharacterized protein n=1 Tax=Paramecium octaurelia TaxID=43137 RepID=A0A8S1Y3W9_PAROT|nr:unnamed protein product [Paramecium octaurelia]
MRDFQLFLIFDNEICIDNNIVPFDGCFMNHYDCINGCEICIKGICYGCLNGWEFLEASCSCIPLCGDVIITYNEECDDGNYLSNDGCHQCKYSCPNNCKKCEFGKCIVCNDEYKLDFYKKQCIPQCQDGLTLSQDGTDEIQFDGYQEFQQSCQIECLLCVYNMCHQCQEGWQLEDYECKQICGDGLLAILSNEQCDDPKDSNCVNCKYQCDLYCLVCDRFQTCQFCILPFEIKDNQCLPICGDNIITPLFEQCDDGNDIPYDGCFECQYQCSFGCILCEKDNHCVLCDDQYYILDSQTFKCQLQQNIGSETQPLNDNMLQCNENQAFINNKCVNLCGNGMLNSIFEQCDDGNDDGGDGCSALCYEEDSFKCINQENQFSICTFIQTPNFNLNLLSDKMNQTKILELSFSQEVYISCENPFEQALEIKINPQSEYELTIVPLVSIGSYLSNPNYQIYIQFVKPVSEPILQINIQKLCIFNQFDFDLSSFSKQIPLGTPFVLSADMQKRVNKVIKMNDIMIYSTVSISGFLLLTGNQIVFFNLLDLLQQLSYIKYMQYRFPPHLRQFLETYTKISLQPILESLHVDEIIAKLNGGTLPYLGKKSQQSKQQEALNLFFLINAKGCIFSYLASLLAYFICCLICSKNISFWLGRNLEKYKDNRTILRIFLNFQKKIQFQCSKVKRNYFSLGVYQLFYSTLHQLLFSTLLQFPSYTFTSIFETINSFVALISCLLLFQILIRLLSITTSQIQDKRKWKYFFQDSEVGFWAINFKPFQIFRTVSYIAIIVEFIRYPEAQSILLSMQSFFYLLYLIFFRPIKSNLDLIKLLCREGLLLIITGSFLIYSLELNEDQLLLYGWLHIALFSFIIGFTLIIDILDQGQKAYYSYKKRIQKQKKQQTQFQFDNPLQLFVRNDELEPKINK